MLSFEIREDGGIQIYCDPQGIGVLTAALGYLLKARGEHIHLRSTDVGGDLDPVSPFGSKAVAEVIIDYSETIE